MAQTSILSSISRTGTFPIRKTINAPNNCGTISLVLNQNWTEQMIHELPTINVAVYIDTDIKLLSIDIDMSTVTSDNIELKPITPYSIPLFDLPTDFDFVVTPIFDEDALLSHNLQIDSGDIDVFNTSDNGIVDTNINSYINEYWTTKTDTFNLNMVFDNSNIASGGSGGGGGGGGQITVDTQVMQGSTNPVQNGAIYDFVNSSVSTNTAYFIGTFNSLSDLENYSGEVSNNDYAFVVSVDSNSNTVYNRYKYNSETETWNFEYSLNNSSFTAAEWETIQSGLTANDRTNYNNHLTNTNNPHSVTKAQVGLGNVDNTSDADKPVSTATQTALSGKQDTLTFDGTYDASTNKAATVSTVTNAINDLDVSSVGGSGKYISAISETDGKISATPTTFDTSLSSSSTNNNAPTSKSVYDDQQRQDLVLAEVVDAGAKNFATINDFTATLYKNIDIEPIGGVIHLHIGSYTSTDTDSSTFIITFRYVGGVTSDKTLTKASVIDVDYDLAAYQLERISIYASDTWNHSSGDTVTVSELMICSKKQWSISNTYQPYALPNPTLTPAAIKAVDEGAKNKFDPASAWDSKTAYGITITRNGDTYSIASGTTQSGDNNFINMGYQANTNLIPAGDWVLSFDTPQQNVRFQACWNGVLQANASFGNNLFFTVPENTTDSWFRILLKGSTNMAGTSFKVMLCPRVFWEISHQFEPYALSNPVLTQEVNWTVNQGVKNLINLNTNTYTLGNVVVKLNDDGTVSVSLSSGSTANTTFSRAIKTITDLRGMDLILNGCPSGGNYSSGYALYISDDGTTKEKDEGNGVLVPKSTTVTTSYLALIVRSGTAISGTLTFKPMIRPAEITDGTFVPYALSNPVLTPALIEQVDSGAKNKAKVTSGTATAQWIDFACSMPSGDVVLSIVNLTSTDTDATECQLGFFNSSYQNVVKDGVYPKVKRGNNIVWSGTIIDTVSVVRVYSSDTTAHGSGDTVTVTDLMICTAADWNASQKYVPYCPSLQDLVVQKATNVVNGTTTLSGTGVSIALKGGNIYRLTANAKYKAVNLSEIAIKYTISGTAYSVCSNAITPASNVVYLTTTGLINPSSNVTVEAYVKTETNGNVEILLLAEKIYAN